MADIIHLDAEEEKACRAYLRHREIDPATPPLDRLHIRLERLLEQDGITVTGSRNGISCAVAEIEVEIEGVQFEIHLFEMPSQEAE